MTVSEKAEVSDHLNRLDVLGGLRWGFESAANRVLSDLPEAAGYDATACGGARHSLLRDRFDRVFSCERYRVLDGEASTGLDILHRELSDDDILTLPRIAPGSITRSNMNGSPGWTDGKVRLLIASADFGAIHDVRWSERSETKQKVARQPLTPQVEPTVLDALPDEILKSLFANSKRQLDLPTYVVAHTLNSATGERELVLGRPRDNSDGGDAWRWTVDLMSGPGLARTAEPRATGPVPHEDEPDVPVRLRQRPSEAHQ